MKHYDIGIHCDYFLPMSEGKAEVFRDYFIGIINSKIETVTPFNPEHQNQSTRFIEAKNKVIMPGLVNGHTHLPMTLFRGLADDLPFADWLYKYIIPLEGKLLNPEFVRVGTSLAALESIRFGVTTICDMYFFANIVAEVIDQSGLRGVVCEAVVDFPSPDDKNHEGIAYEMLEKMIAKYKNNDRITACIAPHAPYTCGDETLKKASAFSKKHGIPLHIHVAETENEFKESIEKYKMTPVERLHKLYVTGPNSIFAHCVHLNDFDIEIMTETKTAAIYNPESNMKLSAGVAPIPKLLKAGVKLGIGTDGAASNNDLSIFREMDTGAKLQKLYNNNNTAMTALDCLGLSTLGGATALGLGNQIGSLEAGKFADVIIVDLNYPHMQPIHNIASQLVYSTSGLEVDTVICHGKILLENREFKTLNSDKIYRDVEKYRKIIQSSI